MSALLRWMYEWGYLTIEVDAEGVTLRGTRQHHEQGGRHRVPPRPFKPRVDEGAK